MVELWRYDCVTKTNTIKYSCVYTYYCCYVSCVVHLGGHAYIQGKDATCLYSILVSCLITLQRGIWRGICNHSTCFREICAIQSCARSPYNIKRTCYLNVTELGIWVRDWEGLTCKVRAAFLPHCTSSPHYFLSPSLHLPTVSFRHPTRNSHTKPLWA